MPGLPPDEWEKIRNKTISPEARSRGGKKQGDINAAKSRAKKNEFVIELMKNPSPKECMAKIGMSYSSYQRWRKQDQEFRLRVDHVLLAQTPGRQAPGRDLGFAEWRERYLGNSSEWFHLQVIEALEEDVEEGSITMVLLPPEHGKTTLLEDWITYKLALDKSSRITYGSESQGHARKVLRRVRNRLELDSPFPQLVTDYGPFSPPERTDDHQGNQPWGQDFFDIQGRTDADQRDYSMVALGFGSQIAGTRCDLLVADDMISKRNVAQSTKLLDVFRQDWLSRPGTKGRTVIIGTRVDDGDLYQQLEDADIVDHVIRIKAHDPYRVSMFGTPWLWPSRYSEKEYAKMQKRVGPSAWARNYQQAPRLAGDSTFKEEMLEAVALPMRSVLHPPAPDVKGIIVSLDPGYGVNATIAHGATGDRLDVLGGRRDLGLTNTQQIFDVVEQTYQDARGVTSVPWLHLAIEDKAFQKGLLDDASLRELQKRYGFTVGGHQTGVNKYDETIGIPAMARDFIREIVTLPGADDEDTIRFRNWFDEEHIRWRPRKRGTELVQDCVMANWFGWLWWSKFRAGIETRTNTQPPSGTGIPWRPTMLPGGLTRLPA